jgi:hypothetical protein
VTDRYKPPSMEVSLNLSKLGTPGRLTLLALIAKFAPGSTQYAQSTEYKTAIDAATAHVPTLTGAENNAEAAKKAAVVALVARDTEIASTDADLRIAAAMAESLFKTEADFHNSGWNRRIRNPPVALVPPETITAVASKKVKGAIAAHAVRLPGLYRYICAISVDPITATSFAVLIGTASKRTISGLTSGTGYWIRYCTERGDQRSAWSAPVYCVAS